ncbi:alcohol dehydrogenase catalytic domain-containing protein [Paludisphaera rhizosphaerae]|uniref:alcohol dehydrogenase catalytic domain-containing protein n=1 Tax=Paludisphaera rhizosphaerae TaxID=2711216 RepID=UPI0013ED0AE2
MPAPLSRRRGESLPRDTPLSRGTAASLPHEFARRALGDGDVLINAGVCHSDLHEARGDWNEKTYPDMRGHEIAERISRIGVGMTKFKHGDLAGVGCMVNSCGYATVVHRRRTLAPRFR